MHNFDEKKQLDAKNKLIDFGYGSIVISHFIGMKSSTISQTRRNE